MKKYIAYYRKSTDTEDKQVLSLESQAEVVKDFADRKGLSVPAQFEFRESYSAKKSGARPVFNKIVDLLSSNKAQGLIAYKADRFTRNYGDLDTLIELLRNGTEVWASDFGQYTNDANGHMMLGFNAVIAKRKIDDLSEDTKRGLNTKINNKVWPGWAPLGYLNLDGLGRLAGKQYTPQKQRLLEDLGRQLERIEQDPLFASLIKEAFEIYAYQDVSLKNLCILLAEKGLRNRNGNKIARATLEQILKNPFYYGTMRWKGGLLPGSHQPIISKTLFNEVQERLDNKNHFKSRGLKLSFLYRGLIRCGECGCSITAENKIKQQKNGNVHRYIYYRCTKSKGGCGQVYITEPELEKELSKIFRNFVLSEEQAGAIQTKLKELFQEDNTYQKKQEILLKTRLTKLEIEKKTLFRKMVSGNSDDERAYLEVKNDIQNEISDLTSGLDNIGQHSIDWIEQSSNLLYLAQHAQGLFLEGTKEEKQTLINCVSSNLFLKDKKIQYSLKEPFSLLKGGQNLVIQLPLVYKLRDWITTNGFPFTIPNMPRLEPLLSQ
jgi:site-specific DNA recombinase